MFELANEENGRATHCGVLEFSAPEGTIYLPLWVIRAPAPSSHPSPPLLFVAAAR